MLPPLYSVHIVCAQGWGGWGGGGSSFASCTCVCGILWALLHMTRDMWFDGVVHCTHVNDHDVYQQEVDLLFQLKPSSSFLVQWLKVFFWTFVVYCQPLSHCSTCDMAHTLGYPLAVHSILASTLKSSKAILDRPWFPYSYSNTYMDLSQMVSQPKLQSCTA